MSQTNRQHLGHQIRVAREGKDLDLRDVAAKLAEDDAKTSLGYQYISEIERGNKNPTLNAVETLADAVGLSVFYSCRPKDSDPAGEALLDELRLLLPRMTTTGKEALAAMARALAEKTPG